MQTESIFIAHPKTTDQLEALKAVVKALNVKFELKTSDPYLIPDNIQEMVLARIESDKDVDLLDWEEAKKHLKRK